jgi:hypothetical protein
MQTINNNNLLITLFDVRIVYEPKVGFVEDKINENRRGCDAFSEKRVCCC